MFNLHEMIVDETDYISSARVGLWVTVCLAVICIGIDIFLALTHSSTVLPNTVYALLGTMFTAFASWAAGPRIAQYIGPQIGAIAAGIGSSNVVSKGITSAEQFVANTWKTGNPDEGVL